MTFFQRTEPGSSTLTLVLRNRGPNEWNPIQVKVAIIDLNELSEEQLTSIIDTLTKVIPQQPK